MQQQNLDLFETNGLDETAKAHLLETTRWTKFIGICSIVILALTLAYTIFATLYLNALLTGQNAGYSADILIVVVSVIMVGLYFYPIYALLKFSSTMKKGIQGNNQELINEGFRYQKNMYRYTGILMIVSLMLILLSVVAGGMGSLMGA